MLLHRQTGKGLVSLGFILYQDKFIVEFWLQSERNCSSWYTELRLLYVALVSVQKNQTNIK
jgi:hypothetical protein